MIRTLLQTVCSSGRRNLTFRPSSGRLALTRTFCASVKDSVDISDGSAGEKTNQTVPTVKSRKLESAKQFMDNLDEEMTCRKNMIEIEYEALKATVVEVPDEINAYHWKILLTEKKTAGSRKKYFKFLRTSEILAMRDKEKKAEKKAKKAAERLEISEDTFPQFSIHVSFRDSYQKKFNVVRSITQGSPIVFDVDYEQSTREITQTISQFAMCYGLNIASPEPFHIHMTGLEHSPDVLTETQPGGSLENVHAEYHNGSFMDLFPKDRLVYLSPHGPPVKEYDGNDIYVIGGLVDLMDTSPRTRTKAKELGIRYGSLPLKQHMVLNRQTILTLNTVFAIMLDVNVNRDWRGALYRNMPRRIYKDVDARPRSSDDRKRFVRTQRQYEVSQPYEVNW